MSDLPVLLTTEAESLRFEDEKQQGQFELGVASAVFLWDDLATAVANGWGGPESDAKREWLAGAVVELFDSNEVATEDVEYRLLAAMVDEFDVTIETDSALQVAQQIINVYQQCAEQNYALVQELFQRYQNRAPVQPVQIQEENEDSEEEENEEEAIPDAVPDAMEVDNTPTVDEDGFTVVQRRRR